MSVTKAEVVSALSLSLPIEIVTKLLDEYQEIKQQFALGKFLPSELNGGRFAECVLRLIQHLNNPPYTPFGTPINSDAIIKSVEGNKTLDDSIRILIPRQTRILLDIRNKRDVAHVGGDISPNSSDSRCVCTIADWILAEIVRLYHKCDVKTAQKIVDSINEVSLPIVADIDGFIRVQDTSLNYRNKSLVILYSQHPAKIKDSLLIKWTRYSNPSTFKKEVLGKLDADALIHYHEGYCNILNKGILHVEKHISLNISI